MNPLFDHTANRTHEPCCINCVNNHHVSEEPLQQDQEATLFPGQMLQINSDICEYKYVQSCGVKTHLKHRFPSDPLATATKRRFPSDHACHPDQTVISTCRVFLLLSTVRWYCAAIHLQPPCASMFSFIAKPVSSVWKRFKGKSGRVWNPVILAESRPQLRCDLFN